MLLTSTSSLAASIKFGQEFLLDSYPVAPYLKQGHLMVPAWVLTLDLSPESTEVSTGLLNQKLCILCLPLGATSALIRRGNIAVSLYFGERVMRVSKSGAPERSVSLPVAVDVKASHLYVPLQAVARVLGFQVGWDRQRGVATVSPSPFKAAFDSAALDLVPLDMAPDWKPVGWTSILNIKHPPLVQCPRKGAPDCVTDGWAKVRILAPPSPLVRRQAIIFLIGLWSEDSVRYGLLNPERVFRTVQLHSQFGSDPCIVSPVTRSSVQTHSAQNLLAKAPISCVLSASKLGSDSHRPFYTLVRMTTFELASSQTTTPGLLPVNNPPLPRRRSTIIRQTPRDCYDAFADTSKNRRCGCPPTTFCGAAPARLNPDKPLPSHGSPAR